MVTALVRLKQKVVKQLFFAKRKLISLFFSKIPGGVPPDPPCRFIQFDEGLLELLTNINVGEAVNILAFFPLYKNVIFLFKNRFPIYPLCRL